jgi:hypothetical protein
LAGQKHELFFVMVKGRFYRGIADFHSENAWFFRGGTCIFVVLRWSLSALIPATKNMPLFSTLFLISFLPYFRYCPDWDQVLGSSPAERVWDVAGWICTSDTAGAGCACCVICAICSMATWAGGGAASMGYPAGTIGTYV